MPTLEAAPRRSDGLRRLLGPEARAPAIAMVTTSALMTLGIGFAVRGSSMPGPTETSIVVGMQRFFVLHQDLLDAITDLGGPSEVMVISLVIGVVCLAHGNRRSAKLAVLGPPLTGLATTLLKVPVDRTLGGALAYPSGHTGGATALSIVIAIVVVGAARSRLPAVCGLAVGGVVAIATVMGVALLGQGIHVPSDLLGGFFTAVAVVIGTALMLDAMERRRGQPTATNPARPLPKRDTSSPNAPVCAPDLPDGFTLISAPGTPPAKGSAS